MTIEPTLTYVVPVYNTSTYLIRCLQSLVNQGLSPEEYEIVVVDDGSTDESVAIVEAFAQEHPQVRLLRQENAGVSAARNMALDNSCGRYIQFVDSDDYLCDGMMVSLLRRAVELDVDALVFNYESVNADGTLSHHGNNDSYPSTDVLSGADYLSAHVMTPYVWRFLIRRNFLVQGGWRFDESLIVCEDGSLIAQFLLNASRVAHDEAAPYRYVRRADSAMSNPDRGHLHQRLLSQVDAAASIDGTIRKYETATGESAPASVKGLRNVYLFFSMTKALTCGFVPEVLQRIKQAGLYPFPCVGPESNYQGMKWKVIHGMMMHPRLWVVLSKIYRLIK